MLYRLATKHTQIAPAMFSHQHRQHNHLGGNKYLCFIISASPHGNQLLSHLQKPLPSWKTRAIKQQSVRYLIILIIILRVSRWEWNPTVTVKDGTGQYLWYRLEKYQINSVKWTQNASLVGYCALKLKINFITKTQKAKAKESPLKEKGPKYL